MDVDLFGGCFLTARFGLTSPRDNETPSLNSNIFRKHRRGRHVAAAHVSRIAGEVREESANIWRPLGVGSAAVCARAVIDRPSAVDIIQSGPSGALP
jgi:hypothetical protein